MNLKDSRTCENPGCGDVCVDLIRCGKCEKSYKGELIEVLKKNTK